MCDGRWSGRREACEEIGHGEAKVVDVVFAGGLVEFVEAIVWVCLELSEEGCCIGGIGEAVVGSSFGSYV